MAGSSGNPDTRASAPPWRRSTRRHRLFGVGRDGIGRLGRHHVPRTLVDLRLELTRVPARVAREQPGPDEGRGHRGRVLGQVHRSHRPVPVHQQPPPGRTQVRPVAGRVPRAQTDQPDEGVAGHRSPGEELGRGGGPLLPLRHQLAHRDPSRPVEDHPQGPGLAVVEHQHHPPREVGVGQAGAATSRYPARRSGGAAPP